MSLLWDARHKSVLIRLISILLMALIGRTSFTPNRSSRRLTGCLLQKRAPTKTWLTKQCGCFRRHVFSRLTYQLNKSAASTAPCPATAFTSRKCHKSVKKCVLDVMFLFIFVRLQENQVIERAHMYDLHHYWQYSKGGISKSRKFRVTVLVFCKL